MTTVNAPEKNSGKNPEISPKTHRAFAVQELYRDGIILDVIALNGEVRGRVGQGQQKLDDLAHKHLLELEEYAGATSPANLIEELGDLADLADLTEREVGEHRVKDFRRYELELHEIRERLIFLRSTLQTSPSLPQGIFKHFLRRLVNDIDMMVIGNPGYSRETVNEARALKNLKKGSHTGWYVEAVMLPNTDEWCRSFEKKYDECIDFSPSDFDMPIITELDVYRHFYHFHNRYPQR